jgi:UDP-glucose 4-epimerase
MALKEKILVTGGAGFIGSHLIDHLIFQGHEVVALDDFATGLALNLAEHRGQVQLIEGSVADPAVLEKALKGVKIVFHLAAIASVQASVENPLKTHEVGTTGTLLLLDRAVKAGVRRLVFAGSSSAYGRPAEEIQTETTPLEPLSPYAASKLAGEMYCKAFSHSFTLETVILRFFNVFGPRQRPDSPYSGVIALFAKALKDSKAPTIFGDGLQTRDFVFVSDVVRCLYLASQKPGISGDVFHVGTGQSTNLWQLLEVLNRVLGSAIEAKTGPARAGDVRHSCANIEKTRQMLGWAPTVSFEDGIRSTTQWMAQS